MTEQQPADPREPALGLQWATVLAAVCQVVGAVAVGGGGSKRLSGAMALFSALFMIIDYIVGTVWVRRCWANAELLAPSGQPYGRGWTTAGWMVPGLSVWMRWRILLGFWRTGGVAGSPRLVHVWWAVTLVAGAAGLVFYVPDLHSRALPVECAFGLARAVLAAVIVRRITARQAEALGMPPTAHPTGRLSPR